MPSPSQPRPAHPGDREGLRRLQAACFGPGRFARTAFRIREARSANQLSHCLVVENAGALVGSVDLTPILIGGAPAGFLLGPLAVAPQAVSKGCGTALVQAALEVARDAGGPAVFLVGDLSFYGRFGFEPVPHRAVTLPGPADPGRILCKRFDAAAIASGAMTCAPAIPSVLQSETTHASVA